MFGEQELCELIFYPAKAACKNSSRYYKKARVNKIGGGVDAFQRPKGSFDHLFIQLVSRVTKTNQDSPRSKMGRSFRIWSPFCHPTKIELKCAFFPFFRKNQIFLKKGAFKAKIIARDMMWLCHKFYHCKLWNVSFH